MSVYLDVGIRADERAAVAASRRLIDLFAHTGSQINRDLSSHLGKALAAIDGSAARRELLALQQEFRRTADVEADAAARMIRDQRRLAEATAKYGEDSSRAATANAMLARSQREHVDAMVAAEAAHVRFTKASGDTANSVSRMQQLGANPIFNAAGIGSVAAMGIGLVEFARKAGDFQQSIIKLGAAADVPVGQLKAVSDGLLKLTGQVPYSAQELADAFYDVAKAGYKGADGLKVIEVGAQLASVEGADLKEVINGLTTTVNDFHIPAEKLAETASKINVAVGDAKTNLQAFSGSLHNIEPVASIANNQMEQVYAAMARFSQSGFSMDQGTQNLAQVYRNFLGPNQQMRDAVGKLGLSMNDLQAKIADPNVGVIGVLQILSDTIRSKTAPDGQVAIDTFYKNADASNALREAYGALTGRSKEMADAINSGVVPNMRQLHQQMELDPKLAQWDTARHKVDGLSSNLRKLQGDLEPVQQLWKEVTGTAEGFNMAATLVGSPEALQATIDEWKKLQGVVAGANDPVKGFTDTNKGLNAQLKEAKDKFGAAAIEIGTAFVPAITEAAHGAKWIGDELAKHPGIAEAAAVAVGGVGAAWLAIKGYNVVSTVLSPIASGLGTLTTRLGETRAAALLFNESLAAAGPAAQAGAAGVEVAAAGEIAAENRVRDAALEADAALDAGGGGLPGGNGGGRVARSIKAGARALPFVGTAMAVQDVATSVNPNNDPTNRSDQGWGHLLLGQSWDWITGHAEGGPLHAPGPKGRDSALFWGADGEHVLTHHEVQRMGGHSAVYQFRSDLMNGRIVLGRQFGGPLGRDDGGAVSRLYQEGEALNGGPYVWGSTGLLRRGVDAGERRVGHLGADVDGDGGAVVVRTWFSAGVRSSGIFADRLVQRRSGWRPYGGHVARRDAFRVRRSARRHHARRAGRWRGEQSVHPSHVSAAAGLLPGRPGGRWWRGDARHGLRHGRRDGRLRRRYSAGCARRHRPGWAAGLLHGQPAARRGRRGTAAAPRRRDRQRRETQSRAQGHRQAVRAGPPRRRNPALEAGTRPGAAAAHRSRAGHVPRDARPARSSWWRQPVSAGAAGRPVRPLEGAAGAGGVDRRVPRRPRAGPDGNRGLGRARRPTAR
ncbi:phage tail tape measure protein, partial [Mycobacterium avium]|uniref:phage tail tape measure protein n=1 Tax=Mycobacterium avium TaxID=1764 RepID=UPI001CC5B1AA